MIWSLIKKFAPTDLAFLIEGETRIGKEVIVFIALTEGCLYHAETIGLTASGDKTIGINLMIPFSLLQDSSLT